MQRAGKARAWPLTMDPSSLKSASNISSSSKCRSGTIFAYDGHARTDSWGVHSVRAYHQSLPLSRSLSSPPARPPARRTTYLVLATCDENLRAILRVFCDLLIDLWVRRSNGGVCAFRLYPDVGGEGVIKRGFSDTFERTSEPASRAHSRVLAVAVHPDVGICSRLHVVDIRVDTQHELFALQAPSSH